MATTIEIAKQFYEDYGKYPEIEFKDPTCGGWTRGLIVVGYSYSLSYRLGSVPSTALVVITIEGSALHARYAKTSILKPRDEFLATRPKSRFETILADYVKPDAILGPISVGRDEDLRQKLRPVAITPPIDLSRFPHTCLSRGCGSPAYLGAVPAAAECSSPKCRYYRG